MGIPFVIQAALAFLAIVFTLIILHEFGHYLTARAFGLKPQAFSLGMGPELAGFNDKHGTRWKFSLFPIGGYVKFHGEMHPGTSAEDADHPESFAKLARWKRAAVIAAGPLTNILITIVIFVGVANLYGRNEVSGEIINVIEQGNAQKAGIQVGDKIVEWNGKTPDGSQALIRHIRIHPNTTLDLQIQRGDAMLPVKLPIAQTTFIDRFGDKVSMGAIGVEFGRTVVKSDNIIENIGHSTSEALNLFKMQSVAIGQIITGDRSTKEISGPLRMAKMSGEQASLGWLAFFYFAAMVSIAIAFMNLLPIPGLDGGFLTIYAIEGLARTDLSRKAMIGVTRGGYVAIGCLMIFAFSNDIRMLVLN